MKKIVRLTERDLSRIIKRTIFEMEDEKMEQRSAMDFLRSFFMLGKIIKLFDVPKK